MTTLMLALAAASMAALGVSYGRSDRAGMAVVSIAFGVAAVVVAVLVIMR